MGKKRKALKGRTVNVHYVGTLDDGTLFDSSKDRGAPITFEVGAGDMISGFDTAVDGMTIGETKNVSVTPEDGYGDFNPEAFQVVPTDMFTEGFTPELGQVVQGTTGTGETFTARVHTLENNTVTLDFNHPMAGKNLNFEIELVSVD
jgi:peptidylprolyl isomerase